VTNLPRFRRIGASLVTVAVLAMAPSGCSPDEEPDRPPATIPTDVGPAKLIVSPGSPAVNEEITVTLVVDSNLADSTGAFRGELTWGPRQLEYRGPADDGLVGLRGWGQSANRLRVAGAAPTGFGVAGLAAVRFVVRSDDALTNLRFYFSELTAVSGNDLLGPSLAKREVRVAR
jgi:hypothetical protein